jgi:hypothetical protein
MTSTRPDPTLPPSREEIAACPAFGIGEAVLIELHRMQIVFEGLPSEIAASMEARYRPFSRRGAPAGPAPMRIAVRDARRSHFLPPRPADRSYRLGALPEEGGLRLVAHGMAGWFAATSGRGMMALCASSFDPPERAIENFLRACVAWMALDRGGFLLHSASIVRDDGQAFLFFGASGAGKSTLAAMNPEGKVVSDDLTLVLPDAGALHVVGAPFRGTYQRGEAVTGHYPLHSAYRLRQDSRTFVARTAPPVVLAELLANLTFVVDQVGRVPGLVDRLEQRLRSVPTFDLHFRKTPDFWRAIEEFHAANR